MHHWTPRTTARAELAELLRDRYSERAKAAGLTLAELDAISRHGREAAHADEEQKKQLARVAAERGAQKDLKTDVFAREDALRDRLPAVVRELWAVDDRDSARWLSNLSFARYRFRELSPAASSTTDAPPAEAAAPCDGDSKEAQTLRAVQRVTRADVQTRARGLAAFCRALLEPDATPILKRLAERGLSPDDLRSLADDATRLAEMGRNELRAVEATAAEAEAVRAQLEVWRGARRMIRKAVQGVPELEKKWAEC